MHSRCRSVSRFPPLLRFSLFLLLLLLLLLLSREGCGGESRLVKRATFPLYLQRLRDDFLPARLSNSPRSTPRGDISDSELTLCNFLINLFLRV